MGRHSLNSGMAYKIKEDNLQFDGVILSLEEGTEVIEGVDKKINELGRCNFKIKRTPYSKWIMQGFSSYGRW
jgi:hypothetical protein